MTMKIDVIYLKKLLLFKIVAKIILWVDQTNDDA